MHGHPPSFQDSPCLSWRGCVDAVRPFTLTLHSPVDIQQDLFFSTPHSHIFPPSAPEPYTLSLPLVTRKFVEYICFLSFHCQLMCAFPPLFLLPHEFLSSLCMSPAQCEPRMLVTHFVVGKVRYDTNASHRQWFRGDYNMP